MRTLIVGVVAALAGCSSDADPAAAAGHFSGTLYFQDEKGSIDKVDLGSGAFTPLGLGSYPMKAKAGTILCTIDNNLADAPENLLTYRHIDDHSTGSDIFAFGFSYPRQSPDGTKVAYLTDGGQIVVLDFQSGAQLALLTADNTKVNDVLGLGRPSWTPDGKLVFATDEGEAGIYITDAQFSTNVTRIDQAQNLTDVTEAMVSHDGKFIAYIHAKHTWRMGIDGSSPTQIDTNTEDTEVADTAPFWSPDDQTIYWGGNAGDVYFHSAADGTGLASTLFTMFPSLKDHILIVSPPVALDWVK